MWFVPDFDFEKLEAMQQHYVKCNYVKAPKLVEMCTNIG